MSNKQCVVPNCGDGINQGISYHEFPKERSLREAWLIALLMAGWRTVDTGLVCSRHFRREDLLEEGGRHALKPDAVPLMCVQVCRICFRNSTLYLMSPYSMLCTAYEALAGFPVEDEYRLPPYVCGKCAERLLEGVRFKHAARRAHSLLHNVARDRGLFAGSAQWLRI